MRRVIYLHDILMVLYDKGIAEKFQAWADTYYPDVPSYIQVMEILAADRSKEEIYQDILSGKFEEEMDSAPVFQV